MCLHVLQLFAINQMEIMDNLDFNVLHFNIPSPTTTFLHKKEGRRNNIQKLYLVRRTRTWRQQVLAGKIVWDLYKCATTAAAIVQFEGNQPN